MKTFKLALLPSALLASCPAIDVDALSGVESVNCNGRVCEKQCQEGFFSEGSKRVKCKKNNTWNKKMEGCISCTALSAPSDETVNFNCNTVNSRKHRSSKSKQVCTATCSAGEKINGRRQFVMRCACPKQNGVRSCGWFSKQSPITQNFVTNLQCPKPTTTEPVTVISSTTQAPTVPTEEPTVAPTNPPTEPPTVPSTVAPTQAPTTEKTETLQEELDAECVKIAAKGGSCSRVKYARYYKFEWNCVEALYERESLDCVDDNGKLILCGAAHMGSGLQRCRKNNEITEIINKKNIETPPEEETQFMKDCLATYKGYDDYVDTADEICGVIDLMNVWRRQYQVPEFEVPDKKLCDDAQAYADEMAEAGSWGHSPGSSRDGQGENIAMHSSRLAAAKAWQEEERFWDPSVFRSHNGDSGKCLDSPRGKDWDCWHFTANVWKGTRQVCVGHAKRGRTNRVVGRYYPHPNVVGQWKNNVFAPTNDY